MHHVHSSGAYYCRRKLVLATNHLICRRFEDLGYTPVTLLTTPQDNVTVTSDPVYTVTNIQSLFDYICIADNGNSILTQKQ